MPSEPTTGPDTGRMLSTHPVEPAESLSTFVDPGDDE